MTAVRRLVVGGILTTVLLVGSATPAAAATTVNADGNVVTVTVAVDVVGAKGKTSPDGTMSLVDYWTKVLNETWGAAFDKLPYKNCYRFALKLKLTARGDDFGSTKGRHRIIVSAPTGGLTFDGTGFDGAPETSRNKTTGDGTRSLEQDRDGAIPVDAAPVVVAHEFGHLFGLGDDRENGAPKAGRDIDTVMVGGVPGVDLTQTPRVDQNLIDRIGKVIERYLKDQHKKPLPKCQAWTGTVRSTWNGSVCSGSTEGTITVGVVDDQASGPVAFSGTYTCPGIPYSGSGSVTATVLGKFTGEAFRFQVDSDIVQSGDLGTPGCISVPDRPIVVPVTERGTAQASFDWAIVTEKYTCEITLDRQSDDEAVG